MSEDEKARAGLFREIFAEQLKVVELEARVTTQPLDYVSGFEHLAEIANKTADLHRELSKHRRRVTDLRSKVSVDRGATYADHCEGLSRPAGLAGR